MKAIREAMGSVRAHIPLMSAEDGCEALNYGSASANMFQFSKEIQQAEELGISAKDKEQVNEDEGENDAEQDN